MILTRDLTNFLIRPSAAVQVGGEALLPPFEAF